MKLAFALVCISALSQTVGAEELSFNRDIRPILSDNCFHCHGQDPAHREAELRLDDRTGAVRDLGGYSAINPGDPDSSELLIRLLSKESDVQMPPPDSNRHVSADQIETIRKWIAEGARYETHWAFVVPQRAKLPEVLETQWSRQSFDHFVLSRLEKELLKPSAEATPETWLRRVSFDLIGLPPTLPEIDGFLLNVASEGEVAYEKVVDRLLVSPHFGERMAIDWLDAARYADSHGFNNDGLRSMWRWRDWVIDAFNENMPYDQFITEQLAGDLLPAPTLEQRIATGFSRNHVINSEGGIIDEEYRVEYVADRVRTMSTAWLGLSTECARCHDHKFDAIAQRDYFRFFAFFNNVAEHGEDGRVANAVPMIPAPTRQQQADLSARQVDLQALAAEIKTAEAAIMQTSLPIINNLQVNETKTEELSSDKVVRGLLDKSEGFDHEVGNGIVLNADQPTRKIPSKDAAFTKNKNSTVTLWLKLDLQSVNDVVILSSIDYSGSPADAQYAKGRELRLVNGELEWCESSRLPVYARIVRSKGAAINAGNWHQIVVSVGEEKTSGAIRFFVDGHEIETQALYDGYNGDAPDRDMLVGQNSSGGRRLTGELDEMRIVGRLLTSDEIRSQFFEEAVRLANSQPGNELYNRWLISSQLLQDELLRPLYERHQRLWEDYLSLVRNLPTSMVMQELENSRKTFVLLRGNYDAPGEVVQPGALESLVAAWPVDAPRNRLGLANWFTQPTNPLTSRVVVNRFWAQLFGVGIVKTVEDFGSQSEWPSHPEVLDWLSRDFVESGWNVKALLKSIVLSATYRQSSNVGSMLAGRDPENRLLARGPRVRLPAELMRDQALSVAGLLSTQIGGPSVYPYQPDKLYDGIVVGTEYPGSRWMQSTGDNLHRRSLYTFWKRTVTHPAMLTFDAPDREVCTVRRSRTNTPLQALLLWNETGYLEAARQLGTRMLLEGGDDDSSRIQFAFRLSTSRTPSPSEAQVLIDILRQLRIDFENNPEDAAAFVEVGNTPAVEAIDKADLASAMAVANMILNLDETITKN